MNSKQEKNKQRVIWITGGKGGVGKSTFARGLLDVLLDAEVNVAPFDGDPSNSQLFRYYQSVGNGVHIHLTSAGIHTQLRQLSHRQLRQGENGRVMKEIIG